MKLFMNPNGRVNPRFVVGGRKALVGVAGTVCTMMCGCGKMSMTEYASMDGNVDRIVKSGL